MAERDAHITLATTQLERALENEAASSLAAAQANSALVGTNRAFRGLAIQVRPTLETLGLEPPLIPSESEGNIALYFAEVTGQIDSLPERLRQVMRTEGEYMVNLVGTASPPTSRSHKSLKDSVMTRPEGSRGNCPSHSGWGSCSAAAAGYPPRARGLSPWAFSSVLLYLHFAKTHAVVHM
jgi:hypothetical protein